MRGVIGSRELASYRYLAGLFSIAAPSSRQPAASDNYSLTRSTSSRPALTSALTSRDISRSIARWPPS